MLFLWIFTLALARAEFVVPTLTGPVVDQAGLLSPEAHDRLDAYIRNIHDQGGAQIQVAIVPDLGGLPIEQASIAITDKWKLGKKKEDRGVLFLISAGDHKLRIEVGQGLEGDLPDAVANRILNEIVIPRFKAGEVNEGVLEGVAAIVHYTDPKLENAPVFRAHRAGPKGMGRLGALIFWVLIVLIFLRPGGRGGMGGLITYGLLGGFGGGGGGGSWGSGDSGGGWSGGGGGFSGGGSSGSW